MAIRQTPTRQQIWMSFNAEEPMGIVCQGGMLATLAGGLSKLLRLIARGSKMR